MRTQAQALRQRCHHCRSALGIGQGSELRRKAGSRGVTIGKGEGRAGGGGLRAQPHTPPLGGIGEALNY